MTNEQIIAGFASCAWSLFFVCVVLVILLMQYLKKLKAAKDDAAAWKTAYYREQTKFAEINSKVLKSLEDEKASLEKRLEETSVLLNKANQKLGYIYDSIETTFRSDFGNGSEK